MSNFEVCLNAVFPLIAMMLVGFVVRLTGLVNGKDVEKMNKVVFRVFLPVLVFKQVYNSDLANAIRPRLLLYAVLGVLAAFGLACITAKLLIRNRSQRSAVIQGIYRSNFAIIGIPIAQSLLNGADTGAVSVLLAVVVPMYNVLAVIILETYSDKHDSVGHVLLDVAKNPLILGSLCGIIFLIFGWKLPPLIESVVNSMSGVGSPMMLFLLGAFFEFRRLKEHLYSLTVACVGRLVVMPAIFLLLGALPRSRVRGAHRHIRLVKRRGGLHNDSADGRRRRTCRRHSRRDKHAVPVHDIRLELPVQEPRDVLSRGAYCSKKSRKFNKKQLDLLPALWYSMNYLSDERSVFARIFRRKPSLQYREAMPAMRVNKIGGAERMAAGARVKITLRCEECKQRNYNTVKNKKNTSDRLERSKYCPFCRKHTKHVETK